MQMRTLAGVVRTSRSVEWRLSGGLKWMATAAAFLAAAAATAHETPCRTEERQLAMTTGDIAVRNHAWATMFLRALDTGQAPDAASIATARQFLAADMPALRQARERLESCRKGKP